MQEKDFFNEKTESKSHTINCPSCKQAAEYQVRWITRRKKPSLPPRATEEDRIRFKAARDYMVRVDDVLRCSNPRCGKRIEITSLQTVVLL